MTSQYIVPAKEARAEIEVRKSRFIASAGPAFSVEQAREFISRIRTEFPGANHYVPVYLIGREPNLIEHCSDAGEPSGTAGRPALAVIKGSEMRDIVVVITRYFGGIKLGTGGLVRAYSDAARAVLAVLPRAQKIPTHTASIVVSYNMYERIRKLIHAYQGIIEGERFGEEVSIEARFPTQRFDAFQTELLSTTNGAVRADILDTQPDSIFPLE